LFGVNKVVNDIAATSSHAFPSCTKFGQSSTGHFAMRAESLCGLS